jgi:hypothetical protein
LEEEKFLFAKLKSEYNAKVMEIMAKRRRSEQPAASAVDVLTDKPLASTTSPAFPSPHHRILPKGNNGRLTESFPSGI